MDEIYEIDRRDRRDRDGIDERLFLIDETSEKHKIDEMATWWR